MRHGEELEVVRNGIRVYQKSVEPLGIVDRSRCWGRWVRGQRVHGEEKSFPHLVISPIHPTYWASVFHLEMKLLDEAGGLEAATALLSELGVNILFSDGALSGYRQATYSAICEFPRIRQQAHRLLATTEFPRSKFFHRGESVISTLDGSPQERQFQEIGLTLLLALAELKAQIRIRENAQFEAWRKDPSRPKPFLHSRSVETGPQPWYVPGGAVDALADHVSQRRHVPIWDARSEKEASALADTLDQLRTVLSTRLHTRLNGRRLPTQEADEARRHGDDLAAFTRYYLRSLWRSHWVEPVSVNALLTLAYQRVWSGDREIEFMYDAGQNLLQFVNEQSRRGFFDVVGQAHDTEPLPGVAIASLHKQDRFIRLRVMKNNVADQLVTATVSYATRQTDKAVAQPLTKGLLHIVAQALSDGGMNLLRVSSQASFDPHVENGTIRMVGTLPELAADEPDRRAALEHRVHAAEASLGASLREFAVAVPHPGCSASSTLVPFARRKLFLSMPEDANRRDEIVEQVEIAAAEEGFRVVQARTDSGDVTENVVVKLRECDAMLQVFVARDPDSEYASEQPDFQWLWTEYGLAVMADLPVLRVADDTLPALRSIQPRFRVHQDRPIIRFSTQKNLVKSLRPRVQEFLRGLTAVPTQG
jgi:hypothetical protein